MKEIVSMFLSVFLAFFTPAYTVAGTLAHSDNANIISADTQPAVISAPAQSPEKAAERVKAALQLDGEYSSSFSDDPLAPRWNLTWEKDSGTVSVEATKNGTITAYSFSPTVSPDSSSDLISREEAMQAAEKFLGRVLRDEESSQITEDSAVVGAYRFSGEILLNNLSTPMTFSISVRDSDGEVVNFHRDGLDGCIGGVPSSDPTVTPSEAGEKLKSTMSLTAEYVLEDGKAVLRYIPEKRDEYYVDAKTRKLVNLTRVYEIALGGTYGSSAAGDGDLRHAELETVSPMDDGTLPASALNKELQSISPLGLRKYKLQSSSYARNPETGEVYAALTYTRSDGESTWSRIVTCDAKTGGLISVYSSIPDDENHQISVSQTVAQETAKAFLLKYFETDFSQTGLYKNAEYSDASLVFAYAQRANGYFFPENNLTVSVDVTDGSISGFSRSWMNVEFDSPDGILDEDAALDAWFNHYNLAMKYITVPTRMPGIMAKGLRLTRDINYSIRLAYVLTEPENGACGVDARTGAIVFSQAVSEPLHNCLPSSLSNWCLNHEAKLEE